MGSGTKLLTHCRGFWKTSAWCHLSWVRLAQARALIWMWWILSFNCRSRWPVPNLWLLSPYSAAASAWLPRGEACPPAGSEASEAAIPCHPPAAPWAVPGAAGNGLQGKSFRALPTDLSSVSSALPLFVKMLYRVTTFTLRTYSQGSLLYITGH